MKRQINIKNTFSALRQMPVEVSLSQVREWVRNAPAAPPPQRTWRSVFRRYLFSEN